MRSFTFFSLSRSSTSVVFHTYNIPEFCSHRVWLEAVILDSMGLEFPGGPFPDTSPTFSSSGGQKMVI